MTATIRVFAALAAAFVLLAAAPAFDPRPWLEDLDQVRETLATKYSDLEWAVFQREADLPALFADAKARVARAASEIEARAAFDRLLRKLRDGHVTIHWPSAQGGPAPAFVDPCTSLGYDKKYVGAPVAAYAPDYRPLSEQSATFPAGTIARDGATIGVVKIGIFMPQGYPALCRAAMQALAVPAGKPCDDDCGTRIQSWASDAMTHDFAAQLRALKAAGATTLVVDIAGNSGGSEWAEAAARMLTSIRLKSEQRAFMRGAHWAKIFGEFEQDLRTFAKAATGADRAFLLGLADQLKARRKDALTPCDSAPLWRGQHLSCRFLGDAFFGSGLLASADPAQLRGKPWAASVFSPMEFPYEEGVWQGPLVVLVDRDVGSAATEFAAVLQDNKAAVIMGEPTEGGCGHTDGGTPTTLTNSHAVLEVPDCVRYRADGSNDVMGIQPDVLVGFSAVDGSHQRGKRFAAKLAEAIARARALAH